MPRPIGASPDNLPDPLDPSTGAASASGTDDLLAQLAGDEIDRMLADADVEAGAAAKTATADAPPVPAAAPEAEPAPVAPALSNEPEATAGTGATVAGTTDGAAPPQPTLDTQLDDLFKALNEPAAGSPAPTPAAPVDEQPAPAAKAAPTPSASDLDAQLARLADELLPDSEEPAAQGLTSVDGAAGPETPAPTPTDQLAGERAALLAEAAYTSATDPESAALLSSDQADEETDESLDVDTVPAWYVRPLLWLNAPFASLSDQALAVMGKVALATLLFSVTLLTYIALTRHRL